MITGFGQGTSLFEGAHITNMKEGEVKQGREDSQ